MDDRDHERRRDLEDATAELTETLEDLRAELRAPPEGPLGLPRPPTPSELLRFTEQYTIPTLIALLEASIRALELLAAALRVADGRPIDAVAGRSGKDAARGSLDAVGRAGRDRIAEASRETLARLDDALAELQSAAAGDPADPQVQELLGEARDLRAEVDRRLERAVSEPPSETGSDRPEAGSDTEPDGTDPETSEERVGIDVDEELASIKRRVDDGHAGEAGVDDENESEDGGVSNRQGDQSDGA
ncbi:DUF7547 family protein [Natronomonas sp.]|uniref:DUF7547 family protein n=1 Tax=Natronomonas sp. TaxID=2184060 RepID=UPI00262EF8C3|nr:hypothetical protein [Natronomonas sp.]